MNLALIAFVFTLVANAPLDNPMVEPKGKDEATPSEEVEECEKGVKGLLEGLKGLEFYLRDKKLKKEYCPSLTWEQPGLEIYKNKPQSHLPESCKVEN